MEWKVPCLKLVFMTNIVPTFIGNMIGGAVFVGLIYFSSYQQKQKEQLKKAS